MQTLHTHRTRCFIIATLSLALHGCASTDLKSSGTASEARTGAAFEVYGGTPLPPGSVVKQDKSFIIGASDNWFGRLTLNIGRDADTAYRFFVQTYPQSGWTLVSSVRTSRSMLVFTKGDRNLTIEISEGSLLFSGEAVLTVSPPPKSNNMGRMGGSAGAVANTPIR